MSELNYTLKQKYNRRRGIAEYNLTKWRCERLKIASRWCNYTLDEIIFEIQNSKKSEPRLPSYWFRYRAYLLSSLYAPNDEEEKLINKIIEDYKATAESNEKVKLLLILSLYFYAHKIQNKFSLNLALDLDCISDDAAKYFVIYLLNYPQALFEKGDADTLQDYYELILKYVLEFVKKTSSENKKNQILTWCTMIYIGANMTDRSLKYIYALRGELIEAYVKMNKKILPSLNYNFKQTQRHNKKIKLGFVISRLEPTSETSVWLSHFKHLDRNIFDIHLYRIPQKRVQDQSFEKCFLECFDRVINLDCTSFYGWGDERERNQATKRVVDRIRLDELDLLTFSGVPSNSFLLLESALTPYRLARKQFLLTAISPQTSGLSNTDYVISAPMVESENAQEHFTEKLILEEGSNNCFTFLGRKPNCETEISKKFLGIKPDQTVIVSGSSMSKISTEAITLWLEVMSSRAETVLVLFPYNPLWSDKYPMRLFEEYLTQLCQAQNVNPDRIFVLPPREHYNEIDSILRVGDIYADSFPFTGATSIVDALAAGLPTVVKRGQSQRSMQASAMHMVSGLDECVSYSNQEYKEKLLRLIDDVEYRQQLIAKIYQRTQNEMPPFRDMKKSADRFSRSLLRIHNG